MISLFRNFFQSKIGLPIFIGFLVIVALAFAASDISGSATFGGLSGDDKVAAIGDTTISANEANGAMNNALTRSRQQNPTITMPQFIAQGGFDAELDVLIDRYALGQFAQEYGLRAGENLVNSEILQIPAFRSLTGEFDQDTYQAALRRQGITDAILRNDIADGLLAQQILRPALGAPTLPKAAAKQYASLVLERRQGQIGLITSLAYAPQEDPSEEVLTAFYEEKRGDFILPERRTLRFAGFGADSVSGDLTPSAE
ncbi:MAG: SurA N-terminal domain-containing protein, partial [Pseudomonadota bacterium]